MANNKRIYIIHGWDGSPKREWFPWIKKELESRNYNVTIPEMPHPEEPIIKDWVDHISKVVGKPNNQTYFIGYSIGCQAIIRYLETVNQQIGGVVFVAGFFKLTNLESDEEEEVAKPWMETPIDFDKIKKTTDKITAIFSDNDQFVSLASNKDVLEKKLDTKIVIEHNKGHFDEDSGIFEVPVVLDEILEIIG